MTPSATVCREAIRGCPNVWHADWTDFVRHWLGLQPRPAADGGRDRMDVGGGDDQRRQGAAAVAGEEGEQPDELEEEGQEVEQDEEEKAGAEEDEEAEDEEWAEEEGPDKDGPDATGHHEMQQRLLLSTADEAAAGAAAAAAAGSAVVAVGELSTRALRALLQRQGFTELAAIPAGTVRSCTKNRWRKLRKRMLRAAASALLTVEAALGLPRSQLPGSGDIVVVTPDGMEDDDDGAQPHVQRLVPPHDVEDDNDGAQQRQQPHLQRLVPRYPVYEVAAVEGLLRTSLPARDLACLLSINAERIQQRRDDGCGSCGGSGGSGGGGGCRDGGESCERCGGGDEVQRLAEVLWVEHCSRGVRPPCGGVAVRAAAGFGKKRKAETQQPHGTSGRRTVKARQRREADCEGPATATATAGGDSSACDAATGTRGHQRLQVEEEGMEGARQRGRRLLSAQAQQVAKQRRPKPARATLLLSSLDVVRQAADKAEALGAVRRWLVEQKRTRSALYSSLQKK